MVEELDLAKVLDNFNLIPWDSEAYLIAADYAEENGYLLSKAIRDKVLPLEMKESYHFSGNSKGYEGLGSGRGHGNGHGDGDGYGVTWNNDLGHLFYPNFLTGQGLGSGDGSGDGSGWGDGYGKGSGRGFSNL